MRRMLVIAALWSLLPSLTLAQTGEKKQKPASGRSIQEAVESLIDEYAEAAKKGDAAFFEKNLAHDYIAIGADGRMSTKADVVERYKSSQTKFDTLDVKDRKVRVYGNTAVAISEAMLKGRSASSELNGTYRSTRVLIKGKNGQWQSVSFQLTKVQ